MLDFLIALIVAAAIIGFLARRRAARLGRGFGSAAREFRRAKKDLPPADAQLRDDESLG